MSPSLSSRTKGSHRLVALRCLHMSSERTLITGATSGIGFHLAYQFAKHGHPLVLVAPVEAELAEVARDLETKHGVTVTVIATDLEEDSAPEQIFDALSQDGSGIDILVNNAGHGQRGKFWEIPLERDLSILRLNVQAVLRLTKLFLPSMVRRGRGRILNVASIAGFEPGPLLAVYHATGTKPAEVDHFQFIPVSGR